MKKQAKLAFDRLEEEMEVIPEEEQESYIGGTGDSSDISLITGSAIWDSNPNSTGYYGSGYIGSGSGSGYQGSSGGDFGGSSGMGNNIDSYVNNHGGWESWDGGYIPGYGYVAATTNVTPGSTGSTGNGVHNEVSTAIGDVCTSVGLSTDDVHYIKSKTYGEEITAFKFRMSGNYLQMVGKTVSGIDIAFNIKEILSGNQTFWENVEDLGQFTLGIIGFATEDIGVGFAVDAGLAAWEQVEQLQGR